MIELKNDLKRDLDDLYKEIVMIPLINADKQYYDFLKSRIDGIKQKIDDIK